MYSVSRVDNKKLSQVTESVRWALHMSGNGGTGALPIFDGPPSEGGCKVAPGTGSSTSNEQRKAIEDLRRKIERKVAPFVASRTGPSTVSVKVEDGRRLVVRLAATEFFDAGRAALR